MQIHKWYRSYKGDSSCVHPGLFLCFGFVFIVAVQVQVILRMLLSLLLQTAKASAHT